MELFTLTNLLWVGLGAAAIWFYKNRTDPKLPGPTPGPVPGPSPLPDLGIPDDLLDLLKVILPQLLPLLLKKKEAMAADLFRSLLEEKKDS
jgi:hypothetical protein